jgi:DNA-binding MarR family transcriptional regulator
VSAQTPKYSLHESLGYLVYQASGSIRRRISRELSDRGYPIKAEHFSALVYILDDDGQPQRVLAEKLYRDKTRVTRIVGSIEALGYIRRLPGPTDARQKRIFLTETGKKLMSEITELVQGVLLVAESGIDPRKMAICKEVLRLVRQNLA